MPQGAIVLVDKAEGWTSHDVVARARRALGTRKVGHAGTLDPMATGLLVLGAGPATRLLTYLVGLDKTYTATIRLGSSTVTDDREGETVEVAGREDVEAVFADPTRIAQGVAALTGAIEQAPSAVSAIKVDGRRAYDRVRAGEEVELAKRPVTIHSFEIGDPRLVQGAGSDPRAGRLAIEVDATVRCSSGTYIRALARDLGAGLGLGGHLTALRRTAVGPFDVAAATPLAQLAGDGETPGDPGELHTPADIARLLFPVLEVTGEEARDLANGKRLAVDPARSGDAALVATILPGGADPHPSDPRPADPHPADRLVGLVEITDGRTRIVMNFPAEPEPRNGVAA